MATEAQREYQREWRKVNAAKCRAYEAAYRKANREKRRESNRNSIAKVRAAMSLEERVVYNKKDNAEHKSRHRANPAKQMYANARSRARAVGMVFNIELSDIVVPAICPILGIPLVVGEGKHVAGSPSLDRIDNTKGYIKGNVQVISRFANTMKNRGTPHELLRLATWITNTFGVLGLHRPIAESKMTREFSLAESHKMDSELS